MGSVDSVREHSITWCPLLVMACTSGMPPRAPSKALIIAIHWRWPIAARLELAWKHWGFIIFDWHTVTRYQRVGADSDPPTPSPHCSSSHSRSRMPHVSYISPPPHSPQRVPRDLGGERHIGSPPLWPHHPSHWSREIALRDSESVRVGPGRGQPGWPGPEVAEARPAVTRSAG